MHHPSELTPSERALQHRKTLLRIAGEKTGGRSLIGGGTILAARWEHRLSEDIDVSCQTATWSAIRIPAGRTTWRGPPTARSRASGATATPRNSNALTTETRTTSVRGRSSGSGKLTAGAKAGATVSGTRTADQPTNRNREAAEQWQGQWKLLRQRDRDAVPNTLGPPLVFSDRAASAAERARYGHTIPDDETGPHSRTVTSRLRMSCAGWRRVPSAAEFHDAIHRPAGTDRETAILLTWFHEADMEEQLDARLEGAYSWRQLVRALHRVRLTMGQGAERINRFAQR